MTESSRADVIPDRVLISVNPKAGARSGLPAVEQLVELLARHRLVAELTDDIAVLGERVAAYRRDGSLRAVVAAGGDGTVALVANHTPPGTPLAVLPLGTENLLSKYLGIGQQPDDVAQVIVRGATTQIDAGMAGERLFLLMAGCGFDADVVRRLHRVRTGHISRMSYAKPILDSIRNYSYPELRLSCELADEQMLPEELAQRVGGLWKLTARWVFVVNLPRYAGGLSFVPGAIGDDGLLDVCTFRGGSLWNGLRYLMGVVTGTHQSWDDCQTFRVKRLRIEADEPVPYQLDGDPGGVLPVEIRVLPRRLTLMVPHDWAGRTTGRSAAGNACSAGSS